MTLTWMGEYNMMTVHDLASMAGYDSDISYHPGDKYNEIVCCLADSYDNTIRAVVDQDINHIIIAEIEFRLASRYNSFDACKHSDRLAELVSATQNANSVIAALKYGVDWQAEFDQGAAVEEEINGYLSFMNGIIKTN